MFYILKNKLLNLDEKIKDNLISTTHDRGSNLIGKDDGLFSRIKNYIGHDILDINDPCHCIDSSIKRAMK